MSTKILTFQLLLSISILVIGGCKTANKLIETNVEALFKINGPNTVMEKIIDGEIVEFIVTIQNTGTKSLKINGVRTSCGCLIPEWSRSELKINEESKIILNYYSKLKGNTQGKENEYKIWVLINNQDELLHLKTTVFTNNNGSP